MPGGTVWCFVCASKRAVHGRTSSEGVSLGTRPKWGLGSAMGGSVVLCACNQEVNSWEKLL